jgi:hypothetical protein
MCQFFGLCSPSGGEPLGGIAARGAAISQSSVENEFERTQKDTLLKAI